MFRGSAQTSAEQIEAAQYLERWAFSPARFAYDVFGLEPWKKQADMMMMPVECDHFAAKTGHKTGKSTSVALLSFWWAMTRDNARVPITSSSYLQVKKIVWREIKRLYHSARVPIGGKLHDDPRTGLIFPDGNEIFGFSTAEKERAAGFSSPNQLFLIDEASGRGLEEIYDAIEGNIAGGGIIGMFGNPTRPVGPFFDAFTKRTSIYKTMTISSEETPNVKAGKIVIPGLATKKWIEQRLHEWGRDHPLYHIRVTGEFPRFSDNSIIPYFLIDSAQLAWRAHQYKENGTEKGHEFELIRFDDGPICLGLDVGRHGNDESVLQCTRGLVALEPRNYHGLDGRELAGEALDFCERLRESGYFDMFKVPIFLKIDEIGIGASPYDHARYDPRTRRLGVHVIPVNAATEPQEPDKYADSNTEMLFHLRHWFEAGGKIPEHAKLEKECLFPTYFIDEGGRFKREFSKKEERKEKNIGHSPNNRDALAMAIYQKRRVIHEHISDGQRAAARGAERFAGEGADRESSHLWERSSPKTGNPYITGDGDGWMRSFSG